MLSLITVLNSNVAPTMCLAILFVFEAVQVEAIYIRMLRIARCMANQLLINHFLKLIKKTFMGCTQIDKKTTLAQNFHNYFW